MVLSVSLERGRGKGKCLNLFLDFREQSEGITIYFIDRRNERENSLVLLLLLMWRKEQVITYLAVLVVEVDSKNSRKRRAHSWRCTHH
jgi:hypothetical protein